METLAAEMRALRRLTGAWTGGGRGDFPTIDPFEYEETTRFFWNGVEPMLSFEQRTWVAGGDPPRCEPLHWEAGFFRALPGFEVELTNAQNGERVEVMRGTIEDDGAGVVLTLDSVLLGNDPRLRRTRRRFECRDDVLTYRVWMATGNVAELTPHLEARLARDESSAGSR